MANTFSVGFARVDISPVESVPLEGYGNVHLRMSQGILDPIMGTAATALAAAGMYLTRNVTIKGYPLVSLLMPAIFNAALVGWELEIYIGGGFWLNAFYVAVGEVAVLLSLGTLLYYTLQKGKIRKYL